jgi:hypothetical protein
VEDVEDREQAFVRVLASRPRTCLDEALRPLILATGEEREHERVLRREVPVEGGLGHVGLVDHLVDADVADAAARKEVVGRSEDPLAGLWRWRGCCLTHRVNNTTRQNGLSHVACTIR